MYKRQVQSNDPQPGDGCTGTAAAPVAGPGFVCVYAAAATGTLSANGLGARAAGTSSGNSTGDGSPYGFAVYVTGGANFFIDGTWAYRAP